ncbi:MAG TPA: anthranilate phosphoribosyltransferase [Phycisphaerae bacterium]|nr:anthranilate phosphoribosyltransferase [Phycisphaerae bacterium]
MTPMLDKLVKQVDLSEDEAHELFGQIMGGQLTEMDIAAVLTALASKGETVEELAGAARAMREKVTPVRLAAGMEAIDTCGTGGDGISTFNVSTASAIVAAGAGATVGKHGNRTNTRASGSAEVLAALGVNIDADVPTAERCLAEARIGFLFAIKLHPAMKYAAPVRKQLGIRTIFNLLGPLTNPAGVRRQVLGVNRPELTEKIAGVLQRLGAERAMVVHGMDGLCDLTISGPSRVSELSGGAIRTYQLEPADVGLQAGRLDELMIDSPQASADAVRAVLAGEGGPRRNIVLLNTAAALVVAGLADDLKDGVGKAAESIDSGAAQQTLDTWVRVSNEV